MDIFNDKNMIDMSNNNVFTQEPYIYYNIEDIKDINITTEIFGDNNKINITTNIYMIYKNEKTSTLIKYSELTKNKFINILSNNMNLIKIVIFDDNYKKYEFFVCPFLLIDYINKNKNNLNEIRYYFNKYIYIDLNSEKGQKLINKCNELLPLYNSLFIQSIIIFNNKFEKNKNLLNNKNSIINQLLFNQI